MASLSDLKNVRFYGGALNPAEYRRGFGVLGLLIFVANFFRLWLERLVVRLILRVEAKAADLEPGAVRTLVAAAKKKQDDEQFVAVPTRQQRYENGPKALEDSLFRSTMAEAFARSGNRATRYAARGRSSTNIEQEDDNAP